MEQRSVYLHEDDYGQIEILPAQNWEFCTRQIEQIAAFSEQHRAPGGVGWTDVLMRTQEPDTLASLALNREVMSQALSAHLLPFDRVWTGYGSHTEEYQDTLAFGFDRDCVICVSTDDSGSVSNLWLGLGGPSQTERDSLISAIRELRQFAKLLFVDWGWGRLYLLDDEEGISQYLIEREVTFESSRNLHQQRMQEAREMTQKSPVENRRWWQFFR